MYQIYVCVYAIFAIYLKTGLYKYILSKEYLEFEKLLKEIHHETGMTEKEMCLSVGKNAGYIAQLRSRYKSKQQDIPISFIHLLRLHFAISFPLNDKTIVKEVVTENPKKKKYRSTEIPVLYDETKDPVKEVNENLVHSLVESNRALAESNKALSMTNYELALRVKRTAGVSLKNQPNEGLTFLEAYQYLLRAGVSEGRWHSEDEGQSILDSVIHGISEKPKE